VNKEETVRKHALIDGTVFTLCRFSQLVHKGHDLILRFSLRRCRLAKSSGRRRY
jgi:hypothetical protein